MSATRTIPTATEMVAYGRSFGLTLDQIQAAFYGVTGRTSADGWTPNVTECAEWARCMEAMAEEGKRRGDQDVAIRAG